MNTENQPVSPEMAEVLGAPNILHAVAGLPALVMLGTESANRLRDLDYTVDVEKLRQLGDDLMAAVEGLRREPRDARAPFAPQELDYAYAGKLIDAAVHHLDESLPSHQSLRAYAALLLLEVGTAAMNRYVLSRVMPHVLGAASSTAEPGADPA